MRRDAYWTKKLRYEFVKLFRGREAAGKAVGRDELAEFWRNPPKSYNAPSDYTKRSERSETPVQLVEDFAPADPRVLEIGCNVGRNLEALRQSGVSDLSAIEISENAISEMRQYYPELSEQAKIHNAAVESVLPTLADDDYDVVFSVAVLLHIHPDSDWIFEHMVRVCRHTLITIEFEGKPGYRIYSRKYRDIFEGLGMTQVHEGPAKGLETYVARVFRKI